MRRTSARLNELMAALAAARGALPWPSSLIPCGHRRRARLFPPAGERQVTPRVAPGGVDDPDADLVRHSRRGTRDGLPETAAGVPGHRWADR